MSGWKKIPNSVGDWLEIEVWDCGCVHQSKFHEICSNTLEWWATEYRIREDVFFLKVDLPPRTDGVAPCRNWREK